MKLLDLDTNEERTPEEWAVMLRDVAEKLDGRITNYLTVSEANEVWNISERGAYQRIEGLPHRMLGKTILVHQDAARGWTPQKVGKKAGAAP